MLKTIVIVGLLMIACVAQTQQKAGTCPTNNGLVQYGKTIINSDQLTVSFNGNINFTAGVDSLCYNYTLERVFQNRPGIAICNFFKLFQPSEISKAHTVPTNSFLSSLSDQIAMGSFLSLSGLFGNILLGLRLPSVSSLKTNLKSKLDTIKSILDLWLAALLRKT